MLYNALNGSDYKDPNALKITTIQDILYVKMKNDTSFLIDDEMHLYEQQSTYNPNMPLRGFLYFSQLYQDYLAAIHADIYSPKLIMLPTPVYVVFYNGVDKKDVPDTMELKLSNAFIKEERSGKHEWTALMLNINKGRNAKLLESCYPLNDYTLYTDTVRAFMAQGLSRDEAINKAVDFAIEHNLLDGFFRQQKKEVIYMSLTEFDQEEYDRNRRHEGYEEGVTKTEAKYKIIITQQEEKSKMIISMKDSELARQIDENKKLKAQIEALKKGK